MTTYWRAGAMLCLAVLGGCTRTHYREHADRQAYGILHEKVAGTLWEPPMDFSVVPHPASRFFDPTSLDDPLLPIPAPQLYAYDLPQMFHRNSGTHELPSDSGGPSAPEAMVPDGGMYPPPVLTASRAAGALRLPPVIPSRLPLARGSVQRVNYTAEAKRGLYPAPQPLPLPESKARLLGGLPLRRLAPTGPSHAAQQSFLRLPPTGSSSVRAAEFTKAEGASDGSLGLDLIQSSPHVIRDHPSSTALAQQEPPPGGLQDYIDSPQSETPDSGAYSEGADADEVQVAKIPEDAWTSIPISCRRRMYEFESLLVEYRRTFERPITPDQLDSAPRLTLEDIVALGLLNSREYQTQKEILYRVALRLSLERFAYQPKFSATGNRSTVDYNHNRTSGVTVNTLRVPTSLQADKMLVTGGDLLARFANDVLLTFNGPQGFAADVGSELFMDVSHSFFQKDVRFESLTQSERDVCYAARDFARFRKEFFVDLATLYYNLLRTYRQIEINSQNYFSLVRAFNQAYEEYRNGFQPRIQVDQVEQQMLGGRRNLINTCNSLEQSLDGLKIRLGIPTETPINLNLEELEKITLGDQLAVTGELVQRKNEVLEAGMTEAEPERVVLLNTAVVIIERLFELNDIQRSLGREIPDDTELRDLRGRFRVDMAQEAVYEAVLQLDTELRSDLPSPTTILQRTLDVVDWQLILVERQLELSRQRGQRPDQLSGARARADEIRRGLQAIRDQNAQILIEESSTEIAPDEAERIDVASLIDQSIMEASRLRAQSEALVSEQYNLIGMMPQSDDPSAELQRTLEEVYALSQQAKAVLGQLEVGLRPVEVDVDDAMLTALVLRFDLMNKRGALADDWRQIKLAGDDLRSILNLNASQSIRTRTGLNRPFDFTFDDSRTQVRLTFDAPLNRRAQRNSFRNRLIDYQAALRRLMQLEDNVKLAVRNDLRDLALDREQYRIDVASAALASDRVLSTLLEFQLGQGGAQARDFLEAQNAFVAALSGVAGQHISYIINRMDLFIDLELLTVGEDGMWQELYDEGYQPQPHFQLPPYGQQAYGCLPPVWYSKAMRRMEKVPTGTSMIQRPPEQSPALEEVPPGGAEPPIPPPPPPPIVAPGAVPPQPMP